MKKLISLITLLCMMASLYGCDTLEKVSEIELPPVPTAETVVEAEQPADPKSSLKETQHQHIIIKTELSEFEAYDPQYGTELILRFSYETPYIHIPSNTAAEENINEFIAMLNESYYTGESYGSTYDSGCAPGYINMLTMAEDNYNYVINSAVNFEGGIAPIVCNRTLTVDRIDERVLSLKYYDYIDMANGQEKIGYKCYNFDTRSGELLTLDLLSDDIEAMKTSISSYIQKVEGRQFDVSFAEGDWYFSHRGLHIVTENEAADDTNVNGTWEYVVPSSELADYLKDEYMPDEINDTASFGVVAAETLSESNKEIIDMLRLREDGLTFYLIADGKASDVRISHVDYAEGFFETERLWYCSAMENCGLQLVTGVPEGMPELKLSYRDANGEHVFYLSQSGVDGSYILVDDSIEAVG